MLKKAPAPLLAPLRGIMAKLVGYSLTPQARIGLELSKERELLQQSVTELENLKSQLESESDFSLETMHGYHAEVGREIHFLKRRLTEIEGSLS